MTVLERLKELSAKSRIPLYTFVTGAPISRYDAAQVNIQILEILEAIRLYEKAFRVMQDIAVAYKDQAQFSGRIPASQSRVNVDKEFETSMAMANVFASNA